MARTRNRRLHQFKRELKDCVKNLRHAQSDIKKLRGIGADEPAIRRVMMLMGFVNVTPDEFLEASTAEDLGRIIIKIGRPESN